MEKLLEEIRKIAYEVHVYLANGYLGKVYENYRWGHSMFPLYNSTTLHG